MTTSTAKKAAPAKTATAKKTAPAKTTQAKKTTEPPTEPTPDVVEAPPAKLPKVANRIGTPAWQRADQLRALEEELDAYKRVGKTDRAKDVEAAIARLKSAPSGRQAPAADQT